MKWVKDIKTGTKLTLSFSLVIVIMLVIITSSYSTIHYLKKSMEGFSSHELVLLEKIMTLRDNESDLQASVLLTGLLHDPVKLSELRQHINHKIAENESLAQQIISIEKNNSNFIGNFEQVNRLRKETENMQITMANTKLNDNNVKQNRINISEEEIHSYDKLGNLTLALIKDVQNTSNEKIAAATAVAAKAATMSIIMGVISTALVFFLVFILNRLIVGPLKEITTVAETIAKGDLLQAKFSASDRNDEVGLLTKAFISMTEWLHGVAKTATRIADGDLTVEPSLKSSGDILGKSFQTMVKNLREITLQISEAMNMLETSMNEISAATSQLVASASETATAISETTTTIEEVKQTSRTANEKAKIISEASKKTNDISAAGNKAAVDMTEMTNQIKNQMQLIAESMLRLSEQGQAIGLIMATVEDMAQQSNLLSVNASIEAAKAGEQGKGFSIVAQEVKTLANQSKQATNQVRDILSDIQKATSSAVMATEQGSKSVEMGVKKSEETGTSISSLVKLATDSARDAMQIAATTHQQLVGMEQAATAMENIKTATFQNVEGSKQLESAAKNIKELGNKLKLLISQYKVAKSGEK